MKLGGAGGEGRRVDFSLEFRGCFLFSETENTRPTPSPTPTKVTVEEMERKKKIGGFSMHRSAIDLSDSISPPDLQGALHCTGE